MSLLENQRIGDLLSRAGLGELSPQRLRAVVGAAVLVCGVGVWRFWPSAPQPEIAFDEPAATPAAAASADATASAPAEIVVHVAGAVRNTGVYRLAAGSRVTDAVDAAGGVLGDAAVDSVNLARILADGEQVYLPTIDEVAAGVVAPPTAGGGPAAAGSTGGLVNLNAATAAELETLPGIGAATAQKIIDERERNGPFAKPEDLMRVPGIGEKKFESLKDLVTTG